MKSYFNSAQKPKQVKLPFNRQKFDEFYSQKRKAQKDLAESIAAYESGNAPRMTKKDYNNLYKQFYEVSALDYNTNLDINDFNTRLIDIIGKYE